MASTKYAILAATALAAVSAPASAATIFEVNTPTGPTANGTDIVFNFASDPVAANIDLVLQAFGSVNGAGRSDTDLFTVLLNGSTLFSGNFALGGAGANNIISAIPGATITPNPVGNGGFLTFSGTTALQTNNTLRFQFAATDPSERFGVNAVNISSAVPEPTTWAMMLLGFFGIGAAMRGRKAKQAVTKVSYA